MKLLNCHLPNTLLESKFLFSKFLFLEHFNDILKIKKLLYCTKCVNYLGLLTEEEICIHCEAGNDPKLNSKLESFCYYLQIKSQLEEFLAQKCIAEALINSVGIRIHLV